ncbi:MAG TPA: DUF1553 domain-containing protein [Pirellulaceae bacterium]|nr:DUF1553 domain-containing protein [Pirellulaceae bacterium]HMO92561.1 DUF1553 domain-containing protein [Pirellulaceae bacterium]HMP70641.1 DUF1553 domain-containing protein [Pirellulaceae bacterium]
MALTVQAQESHDLIETQANEHAISYTRDIRPILAEYCFACHGFDAAAREADLRLDVREEAIEMGAIEPGDPKSSALVERIFSKSPRQIMPPPEMKKELTDEQRSLLKAWIEQGAVYDEHWSFSPPRKPLAPELTNSDWPKNEIDGFVLAKMLEQGLTPNPPADPRVLFRRLHFDITGLPPHPDDIAAFVSSYSQDADGTLETWIDGLMNQPAWGEHRGRYWLDAARYGDTHGLHFDNYREMWPYRDWVIRAFNSNQPFDQFVLEQLAGDLLPNPTIDQLVATGFQRCNITTNEGGTIEEENLAIYAADRVQTFGWVFLGLTTNCAQCHDHKFDPVSMNDYYSLAAFFRNTTQPALDGNVKDGRGPSLVLPQADDLERWHAIPTEIEQAKQALSDYTQRSKEAFQHKLPELLTGLANGNSVEASRDGLLIHARMNEGAGDEIPTFGQQTTALMFIGKPNWVEGKFGSAPALSGESAILVGAAGDWEFDDAFSYGGWIKPANTNVVGAIIARMDDPNGYRGWDLFQSGSHITVHLIDNWPGNSLKVRTPDGVLKSDQWHHVFATYDGSRTPEGIKIYIDGRLQPTTADVKTLQAGATMRTTTPTKIGRRRQASIWNGQVQEVRMYQRVVTSDEIATIVWNSELQLYAGKPEEQLTDEQRQSLFEKYVGLFDVDYVHATNKVAELQAERAAIRNRSPLTHIQEERQGVEPMAHILMRGEYDKKGEVVHAGTPVALHPMRNDQPKNRLGLAQWVLDPANPLTARVTVNRFWYEVFGEGLVSTAEDFGIMGALPSHPELLDWLATDFQEHGWDVRRFFKQIFLSATYRQSAAFTPEKLERDPHNQWLSRGPRFRMDAEMIRDLALKTSGLLSPKMYGPSVRPYQPENIWDVVGLPGGDTRDYRQSHGEDLYRRSLYTFWKRMAPPPNLEIFNAPSREVCTVKREKTNTPLQALVTLNDPLFVEAARNLAQHVLRNSQENVPQSLNSIALLVLGRDLADCEIELLIGDLNDYLGYYRANVEDAQALISIGESPSASDLNPGELAAWTMLCQQFLNLDEAITK